MELFRIVMLATGHGGLTAKSWPHILNFDFAKQRCRGLFGQWPAMLEAVGGAKPTLL